VLKLSEATDACHMPACVHAWVNLHSHVTQEAESLALSMQRVTSCDWCCVLYVSE